MFIWSSRGTCSRTPLAGKKTIDSTKGPRNRSAGMSLLHLVKLWLWLSLLASLAGWTLSAIGQLNRAGYVVFFGIAAAIVLVCRRTIMAELGQNTLSLQKICRR